MEMVMEEMGSSPAVTNGEEKEEEDIGKDTEEKEGEGKEEAEGMGEGEKDVKWTAKDSTSTARKAKGSMAGLWMVTKEGTVT